LCTFIVGGFFLLGSFLIGRFLLVVFFWLLIAVFRPWGLVLLLEW
jgi:hypothetical protein